MKVWRSGLSSGLFHYTTSSHYTILTSITLGDHSQTEIKTTVTVGFPSTHLFCFDSIVCSFHFKSRLRANKLQQSRNFCEHGPASPIKQEHRSLLLHVLYLSFFFSCTSLPSFSTSSIFFFSLRPKSTPYICSRTDEWNQCSVSFQSIRHCGDVKMVWRLGEQVVRTERWTMCGIWV